MYNTVCVYCNVQNNAAVFILKLINMSKKGEKATSHTLSDTKKNWN